MKNGVATTAKAFISPLRYKNKMYLYGTNTQIGFNSQGYYFYIAPPGGDLTELSGNDYVLCGGVKYTVTRAERVYKGDSVYYCWAVIREVVE